VALSAFGAVVGPAEPPPACPHLCRAALDCIGHPTMIPPRGTTHRNLVTGQHQTGPRDGEAALVKARLAALHILE